MMTISTEQILAVIGGSATITTGIFWGAFCLGRLWQNVTWLMNKVEKHEQILFIYGRREHDTPPPHRAAQET